MTDDTGAKHFVSGTGTLLCAGARNFTGTAADGSGYVLVTSGTFGQSNYSAVIYDKSGNKVNATGGTTPWSVADPDNATIAANGISYPIKYTDSLGQVALTASYLGNYAYSYSYTDASGTNQSYTVTSSIYNFVTAFGCSGITDSNYSNFFTLPTTITTPTGGQYEIAYEQTPGYGSGNTTGRIARITYPSGGSVSYSYSDSNGHNGINCNSGVVPTLKVTVNDNNGNSGTWTYVNSNNSSTPGNFTVTETDPAGNQTVYSFSGEYQTQAQYYQGTATGTPLKTVLTCYNGNTSSCAAPSTVPALPIKETDVRTTLNTSPASRVITTFDSYGNPLAVSSYDFGGSLTAPTGGLLSATTSVYGESYSSATACNAYASGTYIYNTPCYIHTANSSGDLARTQISYNSDGKPASVSRWTGASENTWLTTSFAYGGNGAAAGVLSSTTDVNNATSTFGNFQCNGMLPGSTTYPITAVGSDSQTWDCNGGVLDSYKDVNGNTTSYTYSDPLWRLTNVSRPDGGSTSYTYNTGSSLPWTISTTVAVSSTQNATTTSTLDGLARPVAISATDPNNSNGQLRYVNAVYNNLGQVYSVTNPFFSTSDQTYGLTYYTYDALGRVTQIQHPAGETETFSFNNRAMEHVLYPGNTPSPTRVYQFDGLGRLTDICEVTGVTQANQAAPSSCNLDINVTGFHSSNSYDALGNVVWMGAGSVRSFTYDGLSRITSATYPEQSVPINYTYSSAGDLSQRIALAPNQPQNGTATLTTTYSFDTMHRLTGITYSDGTTPNIVYNYDQSSVWSHTLTNPKGRLTSASAASVTNAVFGYDTMGRVALHGQCTPLNCAPTLNAFFANYGYNYIGEPSGGTDYMGITWTNTYNSIGQLQEVTTNWLSPTQSGTIVSGITYNALGEPVSDSRGDGKTESWNYNRDGHGTTYGQNPAPGYNWGFSNTNLAWTGDLLISSSDNVTGAWTYTYDDFGRLASAANVAGPTFNYAYDQYGNRWQTMSGVNQFTFSGTTDQITDNGVTYDAAGNMTYDGFHSYTFDAENRLIQVDGGNTGQYAYDAFGNRNWQYAPPLCGPQICNSEYVLDLSGRAITNIDPGTDRVYTAEVFVAGRHLVVDNGSALFVGADWVGTSRALMNLSGEIDQLFSSYPWGDNLSWRGAGGSFATTSQYTGKEYDQESGLYHFPARQYAPVQGRWLTPDPAGLAAVDLSNPQTWNRYAYVTNNPVSFTDPSGLCSPAQPCPRDYRNPFGQAFGNSFDTGAFNFGSTYDVFDLMGIPVRGWSCEYGDCGYYVVGNAYQFAPQNPPYITPGAISARQNVIRILTKTNDCSAYFDNAATDFTEGSNPSASDIFSDVDIRLNPNSPTVGAQSEQGSGTQGPIFINPNGPFFISMPGTPTYPIGPYQGGTSQAQVTILLHELGHKIDAIPSDAGNVPLSMSNTNTILRNCQQQVNQTGQ